MYHLLGQYTHIAIFNCNKFHFFFQLNIEIANVMFSNEYI